MSPPRAGSDPESCSSSPGGSPTSPLAAGLPHWCPGRQRRDQTLIFCPSPADRRGPIMADTEGFAPGATRESSCCWAHPCLRVWGFPAPVSAGGGWRARGDFEARAVPGRNGGGKRDRWPWELGDAQRHFTSFSIKQALWQWD